MIARIRKKRAFSAEEHSTWLAILQTQFPRQQQQLHPMFMDGLKKLGMDASDIPDLDAINARLQPMTGWRGVFVEGLEDGASFYQLLRDRQFPIGQFVRDKGDLNYTPAPDVVHDLYGHIPFFANPDYAEYCARFGEAACRYLNDRDRFRQFERFFWFTVEFSLVETPAGRRIFGAGIASSIGECEYALSDQPQVEAFDIDRIRLQEFRIDEMQKKLFLLKSPEQLFGSLQELEQRVRA